MTTLAPSRSPNAAAKRAEATVLAVSADHDVPQQYLTFLLGGEMFAVGILNVKEIIEYG
ncbi:MAG TPA: chemotaxis protein CheW, partial [Accumulibacter sp.]|nr:chemotaxis protein CheW [Accumulibacter sp.]